MSLALILDLASLDCCPQHLLPEVPALSEGLPSYDMPFWTGISAPAKTPQTIIDTLAHATSKAIASQQFAERLREYGAEGVGSTPAQYGRFWQEQIDLYAKVLKETGIQLEGN